MLHAYTAQLGRYQGPDTLDITIKSAPAAGRPFAPDRWDMVWGVKRGNVSPETYRTYYLALMRSSYREHRQAWLDVLARDEVTLCCYCAKGIPYCHRLLLAREILPALGAESCGER